MPYIDIRVEFDEEIEDFGNERFVSHGPKSVRQLNTDLAEGQTKAIAEAAFQSDLYTIGVSNAMLAALGGVESEEFDY